MIKSVFDTYGAAILLTLFVLLFILEGKFELRKRVQKRWKRIVINFIVSLPAFALLRLLFIPGMVWLATQNKEWTVGLNYLFDAPFWLKAAITFILLIGASPLMVLVYEIVFEACTQFHHSNVKLPFRFEKILNYLMVTPRMHGIHHSMIKKETDSNYSIVFSFWDRLHKTVRLNVSHHEIVTGVPSYADEKELTIGHLLKLPFTTMRPWKNSERITADDRNCMKR